MDTKEKIAIAKQVLDQKSQMENVNHGVKILKYDNSLIERTGARIVLTEDNRELLRD